METLVTDIDDRDMLSAIAISRPNTYPAGIRAQARALLDDQDLTGGLVSIDLQMMEMTRQFYAIDGSSC